MFPFKKALSLPLLAAAIAFLFTACDDSGTGVDNGEEPSKIETDTVEDIHTGIFSTAQYVYYNLRENKIVESTDSASTKWDIAFYGTDIYTNSGTSGPGEGGAIVLDQSFDATEIAPSENYNTDTDTLLAIPGDKWYRYTGRKGDPAHTVLPLDNKTIVVRTADGEHYTKINILSFYKGNPTIEETPPMEDTGYYTFDYAIQLNGTRKLK
ncbi:HmuY family protein [Fodinibius halophilus]|uniref:HmuY family protein n=1 Tax=Fodinibius halophilus TaxID=1736908 RepID=A0A6M1TGC7_9BACT|nr:HmuY family protein [Fodinibius halophilus]NGP87700.1 hypothetical protein [Fodinibius halophilus]